MDTVSGAKWSLLRISESKLNRNYADSVCKSCWHENSVCVNYCVHCTDIGSILENEIVDI